MSSRTSLRLALAALSAPVAVAAQELPDLPSIGNGARAVGLGFATTAVANDVFAIGWNPAGLTHLERSEVAFVGRFLILGTSARATDFSPTTYPIYTGAGEITGAIDAVEFVGGAIPFRVLGRRVVTGVAWRRFTEGIRAGTFETRRRETNARFTGSTRYQTTGGVRAISPSLAVEVTPRIRVGATANLISGSSRYSVRGPFPEEYGAREIDHGGLAIEAGTLVTIRDGLQVGLHATLPHDRTARWDNDTTVRDVTRRAPIALAAGAVLSLSEDARLSADLRHAPWSTSEYLDDATGDTVATSIGKNDANSLHVGYERDRQRPRTNAYGIVIDTLRTQQRLGFFVRQTTAQDLKGRSIRGLGVSAGQSWILDVVTVDFALLYARSTKWTRSETSALRMDLATHDLTVTFGVRRHF